jgi:GTP-binding protein
MKKIPFEQATFLRSAQKASLLPDPTLPEIALVGRSNVGKSSLINHLLRSQGLAKVSSTPGKTQLLNCFLVDDRLLLVDLPGFGYAKISHETRDLWAEMIDGYLKERTLTLLLFLVDSRRELSAEDIEFLRWADHHKKPLLILFTKSDKHPNAADAMRRGREQLQRLFPHTPIAALPYSIKEGKARTHLIAAINEHLYGKHR